MQAKETMHKSPNNKIGLQGSNTSQESIAKTEITTGHRNYGANTHQVIHETTTFLVNNNNKLLRQILIDKEQQRTTPNAQERNKKQKWKGTADSEQLACNKAQDSARTYGQYANTQCENNNNTKHNTTIADARIYRTKQTKRKNEEATAIENVQVKSKAANQSQTTNVTQWCSGSKQTSNSGGYVCKLTGRAKVNIQTRKITAHRNYGTNAHPVMRHETRRRHTDQKQKNIPLLVPSCV